MKLRTQGTLIGGVILLILLVAFVLPIIFRVNLSLTAVNQGVQLTAEMRMQAFKEKTVVMVVPNQDPWVGLGLYPGILINNTGTIPVRIERVYILNATSGTPLELPDICGSIPCGIIEVANASQNPLVANAQPTAWDCKVGILRGDKLIECLDDKPGVVPVIEPGEALFVKLIDDIIPFYNSIIVYAESARGIIHPITYPPMARFGLGAGTQVPPEAIPRGLYTPISGYILWGYDDLTNYTILEPVRPPYRVSTVGPYGAGHNDVTYICGGIPFQATFIYVDYDHPGLFKIMIVPSRNAPIYVYTAYGWRRIYLHAGNTYYIVGYIGSYGMGHPAQDTPCAQIYGTSISLMVVDGWAYDIIDANGRSLVASQYPPPHLTDPQPLSGKYDLDNNRIYEYTFSSDLGFLSTGSNADADSDDNIYNCPWSTTCAEWDDTLAFKVVVLRDITGVDAIGVSVKAVYYWISRSYGGYETSAWLFRPLPVIGIGLLRLDPETLEWRLVYIKTYEVTRVKPKQIWFSATFPTNKTDIYRIIVFAYDPYGWTPMTDSGIVSWCTAASRWWGCYGYRNAPFSEFDFTLSIEHVIVQYYTYNPLLKRIPVIYLINITGAPYWTDEAPNNPLGTINTTEYSLYTSFLLDELHRLGIDPIVIDTWDKFRVLLGTEEAPVQPIVMFMHGPVLPWPNGLSLYDPAEGDYRTVTSASDFVLWLVHMIEERGWVVVFPYGPPLLYAYDTVYRRWSGPSDTLISTLYSELTDYKVTSVEYIFEATGGFTYPEGNLTYYTVSLSSEGRSARWDLKMWLIPRETYGNYSLVSTYTAFYTLTHPLYNTSEPPPGTTWSQLGITAGQAYGAGYLPAGRGALVWIAVERPGVVEPRRLAQIDVGFAVYVWKIIVGG